MTNSQAIEEAQTRVDSFKPHAYNVSLISTTIVSDNEELQHAQAIATIAIEKEIDGWKEVYVKGDIIIE